MLKLASLGVLFLILAVGISIGYITSISLMSGNSILVQKDRIDPQETVLYERVKEAEVPESNTTPSKEYDCKNISCENSSTICQDGVKKECKNICSKGKCSECKPDCTEEGISPSQSTKNITLGTPGSDKANCVSSWSCTDWSLCSGNTQNRICTDSNNCGTSQNRPSEIQACSAASGDKTLSLSISTNNQTLVRGNEVIITSKVSDGGKQIENSGVEITLTYASGTEHIASGFTDSSGTFIWTKLIGGNSKAGTFKIQAKANKTGYLGASSTISFEVIAKPTSS